MEGRRDVKLAEHGALLLLMGLHAAKDVVENTDRGDDVRSLVEHHALGALTHRSVCDFGARRDSRLRERFEDLRRPDHRHVRGLADPQDFFLNFGEALVAALDCEIAARDHYADSAAAHGRQQQCGQLVKALACFDLENDAEVFPTEICEAGLQLAHVGALANKGVANDIRILDHERKGLEIVLRERRDAELALRYVDALFGVELFACGTCVRDFDSNLFRRNGADDAADFAVVERNGFARADTIEEFGKRDADMCWADYFAGWPGSSDRVSTSVSPTWSRSICAFGGIIPTLVTRNDFAILLPARGQSSSSSPGTT